ncbi:MAG: flippase-like domain-containing protein [Deltaproteobacteria bacterium]|nr:flippase-like domain-containing protein [Deltaproteobacteria bacterium]
MSYKIIIKIVISFLFLAYIIFKVDMTLLFNAASSIKINYYIFSFLILILNSFVLAQKYKVVMKPSGIYQPLLRLVRINFICRFYSMFLTTAMGQGVIRWHISTKDQEGRFKFLAVMFFERSTFLFALLFAITASIFFVPNPKVNEIAGKFSPLLAAGFLSLFLFYFYLNYPPLYQYINKIVSGVPTKEKHVFINKLFKFISIFSIYYRKRESLVSGLCFAMMWQLFFLLRVYLLIFAIQVPLCFFDICWMASLVLLVQVLPISLNGIGLRETAYAFLFEIQDLSPEKGVLLGIVLFSQMLFASSIGGALHLLSKE